jgi:uncharacterized membrane protein
VVHGQAGMDEAPRRFPLAPGLLAGVSIAGLFDGIVLHQILQWHHMICVERHCVFTTVESLERATFMDGLFHAVMWLVLLAALAMLSRALTSGRQFRASRFWGAILSGAGAFNVVEGIIDHHILQIHHVRFGPTQTIMDVAFLVVSAILAVIGWNMTRRQASIRASV